ncbi:MAG: putative S-layer protein [Nanoarchaeota archaeon]|nr:putative S-layer protein [Nanoarchaeota archaeon]
MKMKTGLKFITGILALVLTFGILVSAFTINSVSSFDIFDREGQLQVITVSADSPFNLSLPSNIFSVNSTTSGGENSYAFEFTLNSLPSEIGKNTFTIEVLNSSNSSLGDSFDLTYVKSFCKNGPINDTQLEISKVKIKNNGNGDSDEWYPLDRITVEVKFENDLNDLDDIILEVGLFKAGSSSNIIDDMGWISEDEEMYEAGDVDEGDSVSHTFEFRVDPEAIDNDKDYYFVVKAYPDGDEDEFCVDYSSELSDKYFEKITVKKEENRDKMVVVDEESYPLPIEAACNGNVEFGADVWNIGDKDFENQIKVNLFNNELGLNIDEVIVGDFDQGDFARANFKFTVPQDAEEKTYFLSMRTYYDYDEDKELYRRTSSKTFTAYLNVEGNCAIAPPTVSAELFSGEAKEGKEVTIKVYLRNEHIKEATFILGAEGYSSWANLKEIDPMTFTLQPGESKEAYITLDLKGNSRGDQQFNLFVTSNGQIVSSKPVILTVESGSFWDNFGSWDVDWQTVGIIALNVILLIAIIIVAVKILRKK